MKRDLPLLVLILAGETIFLLPFVLPRIFRSAWLDAFHVDNTGLGVAMSIYGMVAMASYAAGGYLAQRFPARNLMSIALLTTAAAGVVPVTMKGQVGLSIAYGLWGCTTILLFWVPMLKTTQDIGADRQGRAFSLLEGGRGAISAIVATLSLLVFSQSTNLNDNVNHVLIAAIAWIAMVAFMVRAFLPKYELEKTAKRASLKVFKGDLFYLSIIVISGYVCYKATGNISVFAKDVLGYSHQDAAVISTIALWMRPLAGVVAVLFADRIGLHRYLKWSFLLVMVFSLMWGLDLIPLKAVALLMLELLIVVFTVYSIRAIYFALAKELQTKGGSMAVAIGWVSFLGFTPDIFFGPLNGYFLDNNPGLLGHRYVFFLIFGFATLALWANDRLQRGKA